MGVATMTKVWLRPADGTARLVTICEYGVVRTHHSWLECLFWKPCWYRQVGLWRSQSVDALLEARDGLDEDQIFRAFGWERLPDCADCGGVVGLDGGPPDGWQLEDGRTVCNACCVVDTRKQLENWIYDE